MAIENPKILKKACSIFPGQIAVALDVRKNSLAMQGWVSQTKISIFDYIKKLKDFGVSKIIYTDIDRDGTKKGLNFKNINKLISITKIPLIVSGGVSKLVEVKKLKKLNLNGVIIGKAIYDRSLNLNYLIKI
jgi:phosphoribosylformimino-5-aminoimidazole carboxamide ribotide isomerase